MNKIIFILLLSVSTCFAQEKKKSLVFIDKPKEVKMIVAKPTNQRLFINNLRKAGVGLVFG